MCFVNLKRGCFVPSINLMVPGQLYFRTGPHSGFIKVENYLIGVGGNADISQSSRDFLD